MRYALGKIVTIIGTRPQVMKVDPDLPGQVIVHTGQHYSDKMPSVFYKELGVHPDYDLNCQSSDVGKMLQRITAVLKKEKPTWVFVIGDTNSTLAGALAAAYLNIPVAHIEAGMRSGRNDMPEEVNRKMVDSIASIFFCPNNSASMNLQRCGANKDRIYVVGDPEFDAMCRFIPIKKSSDYETYNLLTIHRNYAVS